MRILFVCHDLANNVVGRAWSLTLVADRLGWNHWTVGRSTRGLWAPLRDTDFARRCSPLGGSRRKALDSLRGYANNVDVIIPLKAHLDSFGMVMRLAEESAPPVVLDLDDADYEALLGRFVPRWWAAAYAMKMAFTGASPLRFRELQSRIPDVPRLVSNPTLRDMYGGTLIPHVRQPAPPARVTCDRAITVGFIGTVRRHKGLDLLRGVVAELAEDGVSLVITDRPPRNAQPHERWVGPTTLTEGLSLIREIDVVALPSQSTGFGPAQLPAKLIDAMIAGRAVVASDLPPIRWALADGSAGLLVPPEKSEPLAVAIKNLQDPQLRRNVGAAARERALHQFVPSAVAPALEYAISTATT